jgi:ribonuclease R
VARLTYTQVEEQLLNGVKDTKYKESLEASFALFNKLTINKGYRGALDFSINEPFLKTNSDGSVESIESRKRLTAHKLIEEFMLAANISAADFLSHYPEQGIYRIHEHPESLKIERLSQVLKNRGINWNGDREDINNLATFINKVNKRDDASILNMLVLQSMQRAEYSTINKGHFGLKFPKYTHFTSPIRRYPDLLVHRLIIASLDQKEFDFDGLQLTLEDCSIKERSAEFASKQVIQNLICNYVKQFSGKNFSGYITGVKEFGLFVEIPELFTSGLLHVNDLPNDFYRYNARHHCLDGKRRGNKFSLGDRIDVFIGDVKELEGKISLYY